MLTVSAITGVLLGLVYTVFRSLRRRSKYLTAAADVIFIFVFAFILFCITVKYAGSIWIYIITFCGFWTGLKLFSH